ncbi:MAG: proton-conducting transporter membrane subunit [Desulfurivibrio sp.]|nr:proton-conducting transporter membrane subunit [Desulfurivibrio sp.]
MLVHGLYRGVHYEAVMPFLPGLELTLRADPLSVLFATLSAGLWFLTTLYAVGYLENSPDRSRFFGFFSLCVSATVGVSLAGDLVTFLLFYEMLTLTTYPLVVHRGTSERPAARPGYHLYYGRGPGTPLLLGALWLRGPAPAISTFKLRRVSCGAVDPPPTTHQLKRSIFLLLIAGLGVKAAIFPLRRPACRSPWRPRPRSRPCSTRWRWSRPALLVSCGWSSIFTASSWPACWSCCRC